MAKLSRDATSWRAYGLVKRYEDWENDPRPKRKSKAKDTKKWCRGVEGRPHDFRQIVIGLMNCWECRKRDEPCTHPRTKVRCEGCNCDASWSWPRSRGPSLTKEYQRELARAKQRQLASEWCDYEGHEWIWSKFKNERINNWLGIPTKQKYKANAKGEILLHQTRWDNEVGKYVDVWEKPWRTPRIHKVCEMCGLERKSQSRDITPEDL